MYDVLRARNAHRPRGLGFTIVELLVTVSIIAVLTGILLPAVSKARDHAKRAVSASNLRNLAVAHQSYAAEFNNRQFTLIRDDISRYGDSVPEAFQAFYESNGGQTEGQSHPGPVLGWGYLNATGPYRYFVYRTHEANDNEEWDGILNPSNCTLNLPIAFRQPLSYFGAFRLINVAQFHMYVGGKFYDPTFYAPKDVMVVETVTGEGFGGSSCFDDPGQYCDRPNVAGLGEVPAWSSYCLSPAAMLNPRVMSHDDPDSNSYNGWIDPWTMNAGYRSPSYDQCLYPTLKTHMLEHHWLQGTQSPCNPAFSGSIYAGCEPYYFSHALKSSPVTLFYDGHVEAVNVRRAMAADERMRRQTEIEEWGLWSRDTSFGEDGYLNDVAYDEANTSFHVLTTDGIRGRDVFAQ